MVYTDSKLTGILGVVIWAGANVIDSSLFRISNSHLHFSAVFYLLLFYSMSRYFREGGDRWIYGIMAGLILTPLTFSTGVFTIFLGPLYLWLCVPQKDKKKTKTFLIVLIVVWLLTLIPCLLNLGNIFHWGEAGRESILQSMNLSQGLNNMSFYYFKFLPLKMFPSKGIFFFLLAATVLTVILRKDRSYVRKVIFFVTLSLSISILLIVFRSHIIDSYRYARYYGFTLISIAIIIPIMLIPLKQVNILLQCFYAKTRISENTSRVSTEIFYRAGLLGIPLAKSLARRI